MIRCTNKVMNSLLWWKLRVAGSPCNLSSRSVRVPLINLSTSAAPTQFLRLPRNNAYTLGITSLAVAAGLLAVNSKMAEAEQSSGTVPFQKGYSEPSFRVVDPEVSSWKELGLPARVVHLKGFNFGLDYNNPTCKAAARSLIESACPVGTKTCIVWDGDYLTEDSFMRAVQLALEDPLGSSWHGEIELVCFKKVNDVDGVIKTWKKLKSDKMITIFTAPKDLSWDMLGMKALMYSGASEAYCLGGGATVAKEAMNMPHVTFKVWPVGRLSKEGLIQPCHLQDPRRNVEIKQPKSQAIDLKLYCHDTIDQGEAIKLAFYFGDIIFDDVRFVSEEFSRQKSKFPSVQVPALERNGEFVCSQSNAILRYAGRLSGLYPQDPWLAAKCDAMVNLFEDIIAHIKPYIIGTDMKEIKMQKELSEKVLLKWLSIVEKHMADQGTEYLCGDSITIADLEAFAFLSIIENERPMIMVGIPSDIVEKSSFVHLKTFFAKMKTHPKIQAYYKTESP